MLGFLTKSKPKPKSTSKEGPTPQTSAPPTQEGLKDSLSDPLQTAQKAPEQQSEQKKSEPEKGEQGPGLFHRMLKTNKWKEHEARKIAEKSVSTEAIRSGPYRALYTEFCVEQFCDEALEFYHVMKDGQMPNQAVYQRFIDPGVAPREVNVGRTQKTLQAQAVQGHYGQMDFSDAIMQNKVTLSDAEARFRCSDKFIRALMAQM